MTMSEANDSDSFPFTWWAPERSEISLSPPPAQPNTNPYKCVCDPYEIIEQLVHHDSKIRFQCLAFIQCDEGLEQIRCSKSCLDQSESSILEKTKQVLQHNSVVDPVAYVDYVIRILFCTIHGRPKIFKLFQNSLRERWEGDGNPKEAKTLKAIRQAFQISRLETDSGGTSIPSPEISARPKLKTKAYYSSPQPKLSGEAREPIAPFSRLHRIRSFSNPSLPHPVTRVANSTFDGTSTKEDYQTQISPKIFPDEKDNIPGSSFPDLADKAIPFRFRQATTDIETPNPTIEKSSFSKEYWENYDFGSAFPSKKRIANGVSRDDISLIQIPRPEDRDTSIHHQTPISDTTPRQNADNTTVIADKAPVRIIKNTDISIKSMILKAVPAGSYIYILKAPNYFTKMGITPCVKIGISTDVHKRMKQLKQNCGLEDLERVRDPLDIPLHQARRVEELCHKELSNFNRILNCDSLKCRGKKRQNSEHNEWFAVPEEVALKTVQRWRKFIQQDPYDYNGAIYTGWSALLMPGTFRTQPNTERDEDHEARDRRWTAWLENGIAKNNRDSGYA